LFFPKRALHRMDLLQAAKNLGREAGRLRFGPPVSLVYNPLDYAWPPHAQYLRRFGQGRREVLLVGMNPGPWGMAQTGVPFGDVAMVRDWLGIEAPVRKPAREHPKRPVEGFACRRREVSGQRLWGWARKRFGTPEHFFSRFFIANYCPLCFLEESGRNRTPDRLHAAERRALFEVCDGALQRVVQHFRPAHVLGIGRFAEGRVAAVLEGSLIARGGVPHPSPASPAANRDWAGAMEAALRKNGIVLP
jgi:single-strand selective monofunctional uracil DNA glycosylase